MSLRFLHRTRAAATCLLCSIVALFLLTPLTVLHAQDPSEVRLTLGSAALVSQGSQVSLPVTFQNASIDRQFGGFDLLISYDTAAVTFVSGDAGQLLQDCEWEYFEVRNDVDGLIRVVTIADINNGPQHPVCYLDSVDGELASLTFNVKIGSWLECDAYPLRFYWDDCGDNAATDSLGDSLFLSARVWDPFSAGYIEQDGDLPTIHGAPDSCLAMGGDTPPGRLVDFFNGYVEIDCQQEPLDRGDINLNGIAYEITDYLIYVNYFLYGLQVFTVNVEAQVANSDVNNDGVVLTIYDLVYLFRVIIGDAAPIPRIGGAEIGDTAIFVHDPSLKTVTVVYPDSLAVAQLGFAGQIVPELEVEGMGAGYVVAANTSMIIYPAGEFTDRYAFGEGLLMTYTGEGTLSSAIATDYEGNVIPTRVVTENSHAVVVKMDDFSFDPHNPEVHLPVYVRNPIDSIAAFLVDLRISDTLELRFNEEDPITGWGPNVPNWDELYAVDMGQPGTYLRLFGLYDGEPIPPYADYWLLATVNLVPQDSVALLHCDSTGSIKIDEIQISNELGFLVNYVGLAPEYLIECRTLCGDINADSIINISDVVYLLCWIFDGCTEPPYLEDCDANEDGLVNISDTVHLIAYIFGGGPAPCE